MSKLTDKQRSHAKYLRATRPPVLIGTRVVIDDALRRAWYVQVEEAMALLKVTNTDAFCDVAGVPD